MQRSVDLEGVGQRGGARGLDIIACTKYTHTQHICGRGAGGWVGGWPRRSALDGPRRGSARLDAGVGLRWRSRIGGEGRNRRVATTWDGDRNKGEAIGMRGPGIREGLQVERGMGFPGT